MALIQVQEINLTLSPSLIFQTNEYPITVNATNLFAFRPVPLNQQVDYGYVLISPAVTIGQTTLKLPRPVKYFVDNASILVPVAIPDGVPNSTSVSFYLKPISFYPGAIRPTQITLRVFYEDNVFPPIGFPV